MIMYKIYKIVCDKTDKVYIGRTKQTLAQRFTHHKSEIKKLLKKGYNLSKLQWDMIDYGVESFHIESIEESFSNPKIAEERELYWIQQYDSVENGYNSTYRTTPFARDGVDPNPKIRKIKCKNVITGEEIVFNSMIECAEYFQEKSMHVPFQRRCERGTGYLYKNEWVVAYYENDYPKPSKRRPINRAQPLQVIDLQTGSEKEYSCYTELEEELGLKPKSISGHAYRYKDKPYRIYKNRYKIITTSKCTD